MSKRSLKKERDVKAMSPEEEKDFFKSSRVKENILNQDIETMKKEAAGNLFKLAMIFLAEVQRIEWLLINLLQELALNPYEKCLRFEKKVKEPARLSIHKIENILRIQNEQVGKTFESKDFQKMTIEEVLLKVYPWMETVTLSQKEYYEMTLGELKNELQLFACSPLQLLVEKIESLNKVRIKFAHKLFFSGKLSMVVKDINEGYKLIDNVCSQLIEVEKFLKKNYSIRIFMDNLPEIKES